MCIYCVWNAQEASRAGAQLGLNDPRSALASEIFTAADKLPLLQLVSERQHVVQHYNTLVSLTKF